MGEPQMDQYLDYAGLVKYHEELGKQLAETGHTHSNMAVLDSIKAIDKTLSASSENPVQNNAVTAALDGKADASHGIHVTYAPDAPKAAGEASAGTADSVARSDHVHPPQTQTENASKVPWSGVTGKPDVFPPAAHTHDKADVGLEHADNTADADKIVSKAGSLTEARLIDGVSFDGTANIAHYAVCSSAAAQPAKTAFADGFSLTAGSRVTVKFTVANTASNPTLDVNHTGAKAVCYRGEAVSADALAAGRIYEFIYDGVNYELVGDLDTNTDYRVKNELKPTTKAYVTATADPATNTGTQVFDTGVYLGQAAGELVAARFSGNLTGNVTGNVSGSSGSCTGNAATADNAARLKTARTIGIAGAVTGTAASFDGTGNVTITASVLDAARLILNENDILILDGNF